MAIQPYPMFYKSTVEALQAPYLGWPGKTGWELAAKYESIIEEYHRSENGTPVQCAQEIHKKYMDRAINYNPMDFMKGCSRRIKNVG